MTDEKIQKTMEFILEQQAQTSVKLDALTGRVNALAALQERNERKWERTEEGIRSLLGIAELHEREITSQAQQIASQSQQILALGETTRATDEHLNVLINIVERQISEGRNGKP